MPKDSKDAYYFSHDSNARNDPKITAMRGDYGIEGYGMYWVIIENLSEAKDYRLPKKEYIWKAIAMQMYSERIAKDDAKKFIFDCINEYELFTENDEFFWSDSLIRRMSKKEIRREKNRAAANKRWEKAKQDPDGKNSKSSDTKGLEDIEDANAMQVDANAMQNDANAMQSDASKGKERKGKESKEKDFKTLSVFDSWNEKKIIVHKKMTDKTKSHINARLEEYSLEDLLGAIDNYAIILGSDEHWWTHKYTLEDFMKPDNVVRFVDENDPLTALREDKKTRKGTRHGKIADTEKLKAEYDLPF